MACKPEVLKDVPLFALLDDEESSVLASQVEMKTFAARQRIYKIHDPGGRAYVMVSGQVRVTTIDNPPHAEVMSQNILSKHALAQSKMEKVVALR